MCLPTNSSWGGSHKSVKKSLTGQFLGLLGVGRRVGMRFIGGLGPEGRRLWTNST